MNRLLACTVLVGSLTATAVAQPTTKPSTGAALPAVGETLPTTGAPGWPKLDWLYDVPSANDAAGKITIHWFCSTKVAACQDDLARVLTLKENGHVYVVAYINGTKVDAKKLDPIRESEGVGQGTVAFGRGAIEMMKKFSLTGPASIVVDTDNKIALVSTGSSPPELDARDAKVNALIVAIKEITKHHENPPPVKAGEKFPLTLTVTIAKWLKYSSKNQQTIFTVTVPKDIKCDATKLTGDQVKTVDGTMTATVTCSGPHGSYEATGDLRFGYESLSGGTGLGLETAKWKFQIN
jgi:hypothetical protein